MEYNNMTLGEAFHLLEEVKKGSYTVYNTHEVNDYISKILLYNDLNGCSKRICIGKGSISSVRSFADAGEYYIMHTQTSYNVSNRFNRLYYISKENVNIYESGQYNYVVYEDKMHLTTFVLQTSKKAHQVSSIKKLDMRDEAYYRNTIRNMDMFLGLYESGDSTQSKNKLTEDIMQRESVLKAIEELRTICSQRPYIEMTDDTYKQLLDYIRRSIGFITINNCKIKMSVLYDVSSILVSSPTVVRSLSRKGKDSFYPYDIFYCFASIRTADASKEEVYKKITEKRQPLIKYIFWIANVMNDDFSAMKKPSLVKLDIIGGTTLRAGFIDKEQDLKKKGRKKDMIESFYA